MKFPLHHGSIASLTPSICHLLGVKPPEDSAEPALNMVISTLEEKNFPLQKCLIVAQDAIGAHLWKSHESELTKLLPLVPLRVPLKAVFPPVTPVFFASILPAHSRMCMAFKVTHDPFWNVPHSSMRSLVLIRKLLSSR